MALTLKSGFLPSEIVWTVSHWCNICCVSLPRNPSVFTVDGLMDRQLQTLDSLHSWFNYPKCDGCKNILCIVIKLSSLWEVNRWSQSCESWVLKMKTGSQRERGMRGKIGNKFAFKLKAHRNSIQSWRFTTKFAKWNYLDFYLDLVALQANVLWRYLRKWERHNNQMTCDLFNVQYLSGILRMMFIEEMEGIDFCYFVFSIQSISRAS